MHRKALLLLLFLLVPATASADCTNPERAAGTVIYNADQNTPQVCAGTEWVALGILNPAAGGGSCTNPDRTEGAIVYNVDNQVLQYCDGTDWIALHGGAGGCAGPSDCPVIGNACADGSVFAGCTPDSSTPMFVTRCDAGRTWGGSSCSGTRISNPWNNGNSSGYTTTNVQNMKDGAANTLALTETPGGGACQAGDPCDAETTAGVQPHQAAQYCADLDLHGYQDWYLPSMGEYLIIALNQAAIGDLSSNTYWSSTEYANQYGWYLDNSTGTGFVAEREGFKYFNVGAIRCARRD